MISPPTLTSRAVERLRREVRGSVLVPAEPGFRAATAGFHLSAPHHPALVVAASRSSDVAATVRWAADHGLSVGVQVTGHGTCDPVDGSGVLISTSLLRSVSVDPDARRAHIEAGTLWSDVIDAADGTGLVPLSGGAPAVGAVSYLLGGGLGLLSRAFGSPSDHVDSLRLVTANARTTDVTPLGDPELSWGLRGSRGNLGIVTSATVELVPLPEFFGGGLFFDAAHTRAVLEAYVGWARALPDAMSSSLALLPAAPEASGALLGRPAVHLRLAHAGPEADARALSRPLHRVAPVVTDTTAALPYRLSGTVHADPVAPVATASTTMLLGDLDSSALEVLGRLGDPLGRPPVMIELRHMQGALARPTAVPGAVGCYPDAVFNLYAVVHLPPGDEVAAAVGRERVSEVRAALGPWAAPGAMPGFVVDPHDQESVRAVYGDATYRRLARLKALHDPGNTFRHNLNIAPDPAR
ncbi:FAD-binding oxidoreductase [Streptomyces sp. NPDC090303]|uniref:FAD-binding oxidoreductase n=1 Tax=Streptomyces sp. NPDC090303 TaxID=3365960 RepID=UPI003808E3CB